MKVKNKIAKTQIYGMFVITAVVLSLGFGCGKSDDEPKGGEGTSHHHPEPVDCDFHSSCNPYFRDYKSYYDQSYWYSPWAGIPVIDRDHLGESGVALAFVKEGQHVTLFARGEVGDGAEGDWDCKSGSSRYFAGFQCGYFSKCDNARPESMIATDGHHVYSVNQRFRVERDGLLLLGFDSADYDGTGCAGYVIENFIVEP